MVTLAAPGHPRLTKHQLDPKLAPRYDKTSRLVPTRISLVGAGGTGSQMMTCLARMDRALRSLGLPPLHITLYDPDRVTASNVGRQLFYPDDIGQSKAVCLVYRANVGFGLGWEAVPARYDPQGSRTIAGETFTLAPDCEILITCVDTGAARHQISKAFWNRADAPAYWLDIGNEDSTGQVWLGQFPRFLGLAEDTGPDRLPVITEVFPSYYDGSLPESDTPSCSLAEALKSQDLFINDHCARWGAHLLWTLLRLGEIDHHGYWVNLRDGSVHPVPVTVQESKLQQESKPQEATLG